MNAVDLLSAESAVPGMTKEVVVVEDLTRTQIVQYAGASGDFNPLHTDEVYAVQVAGFDKPLAHGMLTMGLTGRAVKEWLGRGRLTRFGMRFQAPVFPGDTLTTRLTVESVDSVSDRVTVRLGVTTVKGEGTLVASGYAEAVLHTAAVGE